MQNIVLYYAPMTTKQKSKSKRVPATICVTINSDFAARLRDEAAGRCGGVSRLVEDIVMAHYSRVDAKAR